MQVDLKFPVWQRVTVLDDNGPRRRMLCSLPEKRGVTVLAAVTEFVSLSETMSRHSPEAVIVSTVCPDDELLSQIQCLQQNGGRPIVLLSENVSSKQLRAAVDAGVSATAGT